MIKMTYNKEIIISIIIIFIVCLLMGVVVSGYMIMSNQASGEIITLIFAGSAAGGVAISTALLQILKQVQGLICEYGAYPYCQIYQWAKEKGYQEIPK